MVATAADAERRLRLEQLYRLRELHQRKQRLERERFARYRDDPVGFVRQVLGDDPWPVQERILETLWRDRRVVVPSCVGSGKTWVAARAVMAWVASDPEAIAVTTATNFQHSATVLWGEVRSAWKPELPGKLSPVYPAWRIAPKNYAEALAPEKAESMQGKHAGRVLVVIDEAPGVEQYVYDAMERVLSTHDVAALVIGNPVESGGPFWELATSPDWTCIPISAFDTPNFTGAGIVNPQLVTPAYAESVRRKEGEESHEYQTKVLGRFPEQSDRLVISLSRFDASLRVRQEAQGDAVMGLDVARYGADYSALCIRQGPLVRALARVQGYDSIRVSGWAAEHARRWGVRRIVADVGGNAGPADVLRAQGWNVVDAQFGAAAADKERFVMLRDEQWWALRDRFTDGSIGFDSGVDPDELRVLRQEATALEYAFDLRGRIKVESKADAAKRGIRSPDLADAACMAFGRLASGMSWLHHIAPPCPACGTPNSREATVCSKCNGTLAA